MSYVPTGTWQQFKDDTVALPALSGPAAVVNNPALYTPRHLQLAAVCVLSGLLLSPLANPAYLTFNDGLLRCSAHIVLGH